MLWGNAKYGLRSLGRPCHCSKPCRTDISFINMSSCIASTKRGTPCCRNTPASNFHIIRLAFNTDETETFHSSSFSGAYTSHKGIKYSAARRSNQAAKVTHQFSGFYTWMIVTLTTIFFAGFCKIKEPTGATNF